MFKLATAVYKLVKLLIAFIFLTEIGADVGLKETTSNV